MIAVEGVELPGAVLQNLTFGDLHDAAAVVLQLLHKQNDGKRFRHQVIQGLIAHVVFLGTQRHHAVIGCFAAIGMGCGDNCVAGAGRLLCGECLGRFHLTDTHNVRVTGQGKLQKALLIVVLLGIVRKTGNGMDYIVDDISFGILFHKVKFAAPIFDGEDSLFVGNGGENPAHQRSFTAAGRTSHADGQTEPENFGQKVQHFGGGCPVANEIITAQLLGIHDNWQWKVDTAATPNAEGKKHEECVDCGAKRNENTTIPMLPSIKVENLTVAKPVKDAAAAAATTTDSAYTVANTEWMAADGTPLVIGDKFQPGTVYTAKITLETSGAGVFSAKSTYNPIEGKTASVSPALTADNDYADSVILSYTFDATEGSTGGVTTYAITVKDSKNGDVTASHKTASKGTTVTLTVDPDKGYVLDTLTVLDGKDKEIKLTEKNGKYTFTMPASKVTVEATFKASAPTGKNPFIDVPAGSYYEDAVIWAVDKGITGGTSATTFSPNGVCTRAQAVTFLWRAAGSPAPKSMNSFADVPADAYYAKAVAWAVENGITSGTGGGKFSPDATCTRAQIVTFLYRAAGSPAVSGGNAFSDVKVGAYYADAVTWAANKGITGGIGNGLFGSDNNCTRAQIVTFLYRYVE
mgnify:CR=1 FL=1